ncbi:MAG: DUF6145 family protein [Lachnospiraceae bacterium]|jgi:hypothetical protein
MDNPKILCGASYYGRKFYLNELYDGLPKQIKDELKIMCVLFVDEVSGIIILEFDDEGSLQIVVSAVEDDFYFDEIGSRLKVKQLQTEKRELFEQLEQYYLAVWG